MNDIAAPTGPNMGGIIDHAYIIAAADIDETALNALSVAAATASGSKSLSVSSAIPLLANKKFGKIYFTKDKDSKIDYPPVGERDGTSRELTVSFSKPQLEVAGDEIIDGLLNGPHILIVRDAQGRLRLCGVNRRADDTLAIDFPMYFVPGTAGSGGNAQEYAGHGIMFKGASPHAPLFYSGAIDLDDLT